MWDGSDSGIHVERDDAVVVAATAVARRRRSPRGRRTGRSRARPAPSGAAPGRWSSAAPRASSRARSAGRRPPSGSGQAALGFGLIRLGALAVGDDPGPRPLHRGVRVASGRRGASGAGTHLARRAIRRRDRPNIAWTMPAAAPRRRDSSSTARSSAANLSSAAASALIPGPRDGGQLDPLRRSAWRGFSFFGDLYIDPHASGRTSPACLACPRHGVGTVREDVPSGEYHGHGILLAVDGAHSTVLTHGPCLHEVGWTRRPTWSSSPHSPAEGFAAIVCHFSLSLQGLGVSLEAGLTPSRTVIRRRETPYVGRFACDWHRLTSPCRPGRGAGAARPRTRATP